MKRRMNLAGRRARRGAVIVLLAIMMMVFAIMAAFAIDVAYMQMVRTELRAATDAAARAGAEALSRTQDESVAVAAAIQIAALNSVAGEPLNIEAADVVLGKSEQSGDGSWSFIPGGEPTNSLRVNGRKTDGSAAGPAALHFVGLLGKEYFEPVQAATAAQLDRDIVLVLDRSGSMAWDLSGTDWSYPSGTYPDAYCEPPHPTESRWAAAAAALAAFLEEVEGTDQTELISLVTYASPGSWCDTSFNASDIEADLTEDYSLVLSAMASRSAAPIPGGTSISSGLDDAITVLTGASARPLAHKTVVLMTDGVHNYGPAPINSAYVADAEGITIHTITFSGGADQAQMQAVAAATGGNHYHAPDAAALTAIFREIATTLPVVLTD